jgi:hypothetical protein
MSSLGLEPATFRLTLNHVCYRVPHKDTHYHNYIGLHISILLRFQRVNPRGAVLTIESCLLLVSIEHWICVKINIFVPR